MDYELTLFDRINAIKDTINKYGEENFYLSFSGGKDSTILHYLLDKALPNNRIPRVFINTGIEYQMIVDFVKGLAEKDDRFVLLKPSQPIKKTLDTYGYPFKSKSHADWLERYQTKGMTQYIKNYLGEGEKTLFRGCPKMLKFQFTEDYPLKVSDMCCIKMKEEPLKKWANENNRPIPIIGVMKEEGGRRQKSKCLVVKDKKIKAFQPLVVITKEWEEWLIKKENIQLCPLYYEPYNFRRTGCKGCPFALDLQHSLDIMEKYFPNERQQCEIIWKPVYDEYRRLNYRLKKVEQVKLI